MKRDCALVIEFLQAWNADKPDNPQYTPDEDKWQDRPSVPLRPSQTHTPPQAVAFGMLASIHPSKSSRFRDQPRHITGMVCNADSLAHPASKDPRGTFVHIFPDLATFDVNDPTSVHLKDYWIQRTGATRPLRGIKEERHPIATFGVGGLA
ncbi:hypothetical protein K466DRAFT_566154 [Polyporus arcularius HHB13444]|uniref:Uncharacterized protein n=1 Tax=Polyporus arcularius HHB13444 TaxID=1314778 RepID=A0A5C3PB53_9APHY|nr:hypothetical protein K466DRAFT_566154 [Polyporus arcularius HHB13444]